MAPIRPFTTASFAGAAWRCSTAHRAPKQPYDETLYKSRRKIENSFARIKDRQRIATRYDRCAHTFFSSNCIAASFIFYYICGNES